MYVITTQFKLTTRHPSTISILNEINIRSSLRVIKKLAHVRNLSALHPVLQLSIFIYSLSRRSICSLSFSTSTSRPLSSFSLHPSPYFPRLFFFPLARVPSILCLAFISSYHLVSLSLDRSADSVCPVLALCSSPVSFLRGKEWARGRVGKGWEVRIQLSDIKLPLTTFMSTPLAVWVQMVVANPPPARPAGRSPTLLASPPRSIRLNGLGVVVAVTRRRYAYRW